MTGLGFASADIQSSVWSAQLISFKCKHLKEGVMSPTLKVPSFLPLTAKGAKPRCSHPYCQYQNINLGGRGEGMTI